MPWQPDYARTWEWDGTTWTVAATGSQLGFYHVVGHSGRGTVMAFGGSSWPATSLYEWNGTVWNLIPVTAAPPQQFTTNPTTVQEYFSAAYDARRDKHVSPAIWARDAAQGWVSRTVAFPTTFQPVTRMHFDAHRGTLVVIMGDAGGERLFEWDGGSSWQELVPVSQPAFSSRQDSLTNGYDLRRGALYTLRWMYQTSTISGYTLGHLYPARFEVRGAGCAGTLGEPELRLRQPWTRAWLGRALEVELTELPLSSGIVALGFSEQNYGVLPLPASLASYGMPGCFARVAPDAVHFVSGASNTAILTLPVPNHLALIGMVLYQQGYAIDPGANPAGMTTSSSVRVTIGRL
jgi:hypothetical protein